MAKTKTADATIIMARVKSFEDACAVQGLDPVVEMGYFDGLPESIREYHRGIHRCDTIINALNEGFVFDWDDDDQPKYFNYYWMNGPAGFRFDGSDCDCTDTFAGAGSGPFANRQLAEYFGRQFLHEAKPVFVRKSARL